jgi:cystathionine beta-lyase family protein involved in aluminum resistance
VTAGNLLDRAFSESREEVLPVWVKIDETVMANQERVLDAFVAEKVALHHMAGTTGYGYGDAGRDTLDRLYARVFGAERGLVRTHWVSGTHALKTALFALLRPGDDVLCVTGPSYDTLAPVTGERGLKGFGIAYRETDSLLLYEEARVGMDEVEADLAEKIRDHTKVIYIQRSRGYTARKSISLSSLTEFARLVRKKWPGVFTVVDNCYCEFTGTAEPPVAGISLTVGSLIKNPGGGLAPTGAYAVGDEEPVTRVAESLYAPGLGNEAGSYASGYRELYQGLFLAPKVVGECLKGIAFAASYLSRLGFQVDPGPVEERSDIVQAVTLGSPERLRAFAAAIQASSPVDSFATPEPWDMPGYDRPIIMAAGTFVQGSSMELTCDAPFTEPYTAYLQGGLTKEHVMLAVRRAASKALGT